MKSSQVWTFYRPKMWTIHIFEPLKAHIYEPDISLIWMRLIMQKPEYSILIIGHVWICVDGILRTTKAHGN